MTSKLAIACFVLAVTCRAAIAGAVDDCVPSSPSAVIMHACTEIIEGASFGSDQKALAYKYRGDVRLQAGAIQPAIADFNESIRLKKEDARAFADRGWAKFLGGDRAGSIADYSEAIRLSPAVTEFFIERGHINLVADKTDDAIRDLTEAVRLDPKSADAFNRRGLAYFKKGDLIRAQEDYSAAIKLDPLVAVYYANRGYVYRAEDRKKDAIADFGHALLLDPSLSEAMNALKMLDLRGKTPTRTNQLIRQGKQVAEKNCRSCHAVGARDVSRNRNAPEFRNLSQRHPHLILRPPIERAIAATHDVMPALNLSFEEIEAIVAYINSFVTR
jgi:tetratricopeptide (TPR) repeat protein